MSVTIRDVARHARVSVKTVSRVINNEEPVRPATRARVLGSIDELGFVVNVAAQRLARGRSHTIGFVFSDASWHYLSLVLHSILETGRKAGYSLKIHPSDGKKDVDRHSIIRLAVQGSVDGFVFSPPAEHTEGLLEQLDSLGVPFVCLTPNRREQVWPFVTATDFRGAEDMTEYLLSMGHRRIGYIRGRCTQRASVDRFDAYCRTLARKGIPVDPELVLDGDDLFPRGQSCGEALLRQHPRPTAIFANNDEMAAGVLVSAHQLGVAVPGELSVAGFDDTPLSRQVWPSLTTIHQPVQQIAQTATEVLIRLMEGQEAGEYLQEMPTRLVIRDSTGPCSGI